MPGQAADASPTAAAGEALVNAGLDPRCDADYTYSPYTNEIGWARPSRLWSDDIDAGVLLEADGVHDR